MKWLLIGGLLLIAVPRGVNAMEQEKEKQAIERENLPRGIRNNNPLNIRYSKANNWQGQTGTDGEYAIFDTPTNGIRAAAKLLNNYYFKYNLQTVAGIINKWSPPIENNTNAYVKAVANKLNVSENEVLLWPTSISGLIDAMTHHENGVQPYTTNEINSGITAAGIN